MTTRSARNRDVSLALSIPPMMHSRQLTTAPSKLYRACPVTAPSTCTHVWQLGGAAEWM